MTHDEGWWRVKFDLSLSNPQCLSAFRANRWRVKGILCILLFINADAIFLTADAIFLTTYAIKLPACGTIVSCNEHNCAFQRAILHKAICLIGRFLQELRSSEVARAYLIIYTLTSLTSVQEKVKVHSFRKYAPRAGDHWLWACCFYELLGLSTFLNYKRKLKYIYTVYLFHNCKKMVFQLGNRIHLTGK